MHFNFEIFFYIVEYFFQDVLIMQTNKKKSSVTSLQHSEDPLSLQQKDVRSDPKIVQEVSAATDYLLENLGALAVEVDTPHTYCTKRTQPTHVSTEQDN